MIEDYRRYDYYNSYESNKRFRYGEEFEDVKDMISLEH